MGITPAAASTGSPQKAKKPSKRKRKRKRAKVTCALCGEQFKRITATHLQSHNMTTAQYQRVFMAATASQPPTTTGRPPHLPPEPAPPLASSLVQRTAEALVDNDDFVATLANEAGELLFGTLFRERLRLSLAQLLSRRLEMQGAAQAHLERVRAELDQPWRLTAGGKDGAPTPTPHLVAMAGEAHHEVVKAEDALLKTMRLALEETRQNKEALANLAGRPTFSGRAETGIPVPPELDAQEREAVRSLVHLLQQELTARAHKTRTVIDVTPAQVQTACSQKGSDPGMSAHPAKASISYEDAAGPPESPQRLAGSSALGALQPLEPPADPGDDLPLA